jgi:hypothetical protein
VANQNVSHYLAGGQCFGPFMTRNLTPDANGLPEGLTEAEFVRVMRTGEDVHCKSPRRMRSARLGRREINNTSVSWRQIGGESVVLVRNGRRGI